MQQVQIQSLNLHMKINILKYIVDTSYASGTSYIKYKFLHYQILSIHALFLSPFL